MTANEPNDDRVIVVICDQRGTGYSWANSAICPLAAAELMAASKADPPKEKTPRVPDQTPSVPLRQRRKMLERIRRRRS